MITTNNSNKIKNYNSLLYDNGPVKFSDYIVNKYNNIHNQLYNYALELYFKDYVKTEILTSAVIYDLFMLFKDSKYKINNIISTYNENIELYTNLSVSLNKMNINNEKILNILFEITNTKIEFIKKHITDKNLIYINKLTDINNIYILYKNKMYSISANSIYKDEINLEKDIIWYNKNENDDTKIGLSSTGKYYIDILNINNFFYFEDKLKDIINKKSSEFNDILYIYLKNEFNKYHKYIEIKNTEYWKSSKVIIIGLKRPFTKNIVDLENYWNYYQKKENKKTDSYKINSKDNNYDSELKYIDYVRGKAIMETKEDGQEFEVDFDYLNEDTKISEEYSLDNLFFTKYINNNY